jgi:lysozyme
MPLLNAVIDLSHHNTVTSFQEVKGDGILAVIHKATQGTGFVDAEYDRRRAGALAAGLFWGAYHFGVGGDVQGQVNHFLDIVNPDPTDLLVLDFEPNPRGPTMTLAEAESFVTKVQGQTGRFPGLYSGHFFLREQLGNNTNTVLKNCFLWIARFSSQLPEIPPAFPTFTLLQYTDGNDGPQPHQVRGIGRCDRDKFNGDEAGLRKLFGQPDN